MKEGPGLSALWMVEEEVAWLNDKSTGIWIERPQGQIPDQTTTFSMWMGGEVLCITNMHTLKNPQQKKYALAKGCTISNNVTDLMGMSSITLLELAFPGKSNSNFLWENSHLGHYTHY